MKATQKLSVVFATLAAFAVLISCQKTDLETMSGSYTYKTSGVVGLVPTQLIGTGLPIDTTWVALTPEQGQVNIVTKDSNNSTIIITWNDLTGNACSTEARVDGKKLIMTPNTKSASLTDGTMSMGTVTIIGGGIVSYYGTGTLYDNMLLIDMIYQGTFTISGTQMTVVASKVECIAKAN